MTWLDCGRCILREEDSEAWRWTPTVLLYFTAVKQYNCVVMGHLQLYLNGPSVNEIERRTPSLAASILVSISTDRQGPEHE